MSVSRPPPRGEERGKTPPRRLRGEDAASPARLAGGANPSPLLLPGGGEDPCGRHAPAAAPGNPEFPGGVSLPQIPGEVLQPPEPRNSRSHLVHLAQRPVASGSGLRSLGDSGSPEGILAAAEPREAKGSLASLAQGSRASGFSFGAQTPDSRLQVSTFNFGVQTPNFKLQTSTFNFGVQSSNFKFQLRSSDSRLQVSALGFGLQASGFSPGLLAGLKPGPLPQESPIPRGESTSPGVPGSPGGKEVPGIPGVLWGESFDPGAKGVPRIWRESRQSGSLWIPRGSPLVQESPGSPRESPDPGEVLWSGESPEVPESQEVLLLQAEALRIPGESPLVRGVPGAFSPGESLEARESPGIRSPPGSPLALEPSGFPPGSGGSSVSPGIPWKSPDPRGRARLALDSRIPGGKGREGGAGFTPGAPSVTLRQAAGADRPWAAPVASRRLGPCHGRGRGRDVRLGRSWRDWRSPGGGERKKGRREEEGAQGG